MYCITLAKERKEEKGNSGVTFLHYHEVMSRVYPVNTFLTTVDWSRTTRIKQWERNVVLG